MTDTYIDAGNVERAHTGLFFASGTELTRDEARHHGLTPMPTPAPRHPTAAILPRYSGYRPMVRDELVSLFRHQWIGTTANPDLEDVNQYIRSNGLEPVGYEPFRDPPVMDDDTRTDDRIRIMRSYEEQRGMTAKSRALFDVNGCPVFVPDILKPTDFDTPAQRDRKMESINAQYA